MTRLGFIGTGKIGSAIVRGLQTASGFSGSVVLSPRNAAVAAQLSAEFPSVSVGDSNQDVLERSDIIFLTLRPQTAAEIIATLRFRPDHQVISAVAALSHARLRELVSPAISVVKAIPLPPVAQNRGITALYPGDSFACELFRHLGRALPVSEEKHFHAMSTATAIVASYAVMADIAASWLAAKGLENSAARGYINSLLAAIVETAGSSGESYAEIAESHATKGGLNEQLRIFLEEQGVFDSLSAGLEQVFARVSGTTS